jgi:hypothetical protein
MTTRCLALLLAFVILPAALSGCLGSKKTKESPHPAAELEEGFKERWVTKRVGELLQAGTAPDGLQARRIALQEFKERYEYVRGLEQPVR